MVGIDHRDSSIEIYIYKQWLALKNETEAMPCDDSVNACDI